MTDEELIARLRKFGELWPDDAVAADRIEALVKERDALRAERDSLLRGHRTLNVSGAKLGDRLTAAEAEVEKLRGALESIARDVDLMATGHTSLLGKMGRTARAALQGEG